jgi:3-oxoacyl-[acyl-carrier protein] reductase
MRSIALRRMKALVLTAVLLIGGSGASALDLALYHLGANPEAVTHRVGVCARTASQVASSVAELRAAGIEAAGRAADVSDPGQVQAVVEQVAGELGEIGVLVNNAGVLIARPIEELTVDDWDVTMAINLRGVFLMTRAVLPAMRARQQGDIVNVASLSARNGFVGGSAYATSKHAVLGFSRSLMLELRKEGIRVIAVCPGSVDTDMIRDQPMLKPDPTRILKPEDVAETILQSLRLPARALVSELDIRPSNP